MEATTFIQACLSLPNPSAESLLSSIKSSPQAIGFSRQILTNNSIVSTQVRFQASLILRDSSIRQHESLTLEQRSELRRWCLQFCLSLNNEPPVLSTMLQACALMWKRAWLDFDNDNQRAEPFLQAKSLLPQPIGAMLLNSLVAEFSSTKSSSIGLSFEFHRRCAQSFEQNFGLRECFFIAYEYVFVVPTSSLILLLQTLEVCLAWPFSSCSSTSTSVANILIPIDSASADALVRSTNVRVNPGKKWHGLLQDSLGPYSRLMRLYFTTRNTSVSCPIRQVLLALSALSGDIFDNDTQRLDYCGIGFDCTCELFSLSKKDDRDEIYDACWMISRLLTCVSPLLLTTHGKDIVDKFTLLSVSLFESVRLEECMEALMNVWVLWGSFAANNEDNNVRLSCCKVFQALIAANFRHLSRFAKHSDGNDDDDKESDEDDEEDFINAASIGRLNASSSLVLIGQLIAETSGLKTFDSLERRVFALKLLSYLLADSSQGETPIIPSLLMQSSQEPIVHSSLILLQGLEFETATPSSPLVVETSLNCVARWASTYLNPSPSLYNGNSSSYGSMHSPGALLVEKFCNQPGLEIVDLLVKLTSINLARGTNESDVAAACINLFSVLCKHCTRAGQLIGLQSWQQLLINHSQALQDDGWHPLNTLSPNLLGQLSKVLFVSIGTVLDPVQNGQKFSEFVAGPLAVRMNLLQSTAAVKRKELWIQDCCKTLEVCRGLAMSCTLGQTGLKVRHFIIEELLPKVLLLAKAACALESELLTQSVLLFLADFCEVQLVFIEASTLPIVYQAGKEIIELYCKVASWHHRATGVEDHSYYYESRAEELSYMLRILIALSDRSSLDFSQDDNHGDEEFDPAVAVLSSVDLVLPLVKPELLKYQGITDKYFEFISSLCHTHAGHVLSLSEQILHAVLSSLIFGTLLPEAKNERRALESIASLAQWHAEKTSRVPNEVFLNLSKSVLKLLVYSSSNEIECASLALFCLACCHVLLPACEWLIMDQQDNFLREKIRENLSELGNQVNFDLKNRLDRKRFALNVNILVEKLRGFVLIK